jgi:hypothetical protein
MHNSKRIYEEMKKLTDFLMIDNPELNICFPLEDVGTGFRGQSKNTSESAAS